MLVCCKQEVFDVISMSNLVISMFLLQICWSSYPKKKNKI